MVAVVALTYASRFEAASANDGWEWVRARKAGMS
jgi:hypothetical protein